MSRDLQASYLAEIIKGTVMPVLLARIETSSVHILAWSGRGDIIYNSETYTGVGVFGTVTSVEETTGLKATGISFTLQGFAPSLISAALQTIEQGRSARLFLGFLDSNGALVDDTIEIFDGLTDVPTIRHNAEVGSITLSAETYLIIFKEASKRRYTGEDQKVQFPLDLGFDFVPGLQDTSVVFGRT